MSFRGPFHLHCMWLLFLISQFFVLTGKNHLSLCQEILHVFLKSCHGGLEVECHLVVLLMLAKHQVKGKDVIAEVVQGVPEVVDDHVVAGNPGGHPVQGRRGSRFVYRHFGW